MCVSLIQEQAARSAALAMGLKKEVVEMDIVVIVKRRMRLPKLLIENYCSMNIDVSGRF